MGRYLFELFGVSLGLTLVIELAVGALLGMRTGRQILLVILVNVLTNPAAVLACWLGAPQLPVEVVVVIVEAVVYRWFEQPHPLGKSLIANGISWACGLILGGIL